MKFVGLSCALSAFSMVFAGCSGSAHLLGENAGGHSGNGGAAGEQSGAGVSGWSGDGSSTAGFGATSGMAGSAAGGSGGSGMAGRGGAGTGGSGTAGSNTGGAGGTNVAGASGSGGGDPELGCTQSGGTVTTALCCGTAHDFPNQCAIGACSCAPSASHEVKVCSCPAGLCFLGQACVAFGG